MFIDLQNNHQKLISEIKWDGNAFEKILNESGAELFYLNESLGSYQVRRNYFDQEGSSDILFQCNSDSQKLDYIRKKSSSISKIKVRKCMICLETQLETLFIECKACSDQYHFTCLNWLSKRKRGQFYHDNYAQTKTFEFYKSGNRKAHNKKEDSSSVYWICQICTNKIRNPEIIKFELQYPFEVQKLPEIKQNTKYDIPFQMFFGDIKDISLYDIPDNFDEAMKQKNLSFQDECVYLSKAKSKHNLTKFSEEPITVLK